MQASIPDCAVFFKHYKIPIDDSPFQKLPAHLKPLLSQIVSVINSEFDFKRGPCRAEKLYATVNHAANFLRLYLSDVRKSFYIVKDDDEWTLNDEDEFFDLYADGEETENVYYPPN